MLYYLLLLLAGALQGVMVSLNGQLGNYYSPFAICFFVHGIALILLLAYLLAKKTPLGFKGAPWYVYLVGALGIFDLDLHDHAVIRVHGGFPQLVGVHLTKAFVAVDLGTRHFLGKDSHFGVIVGASHLPRL